MYDQNYSNGVLCSEEHPWNNSVAKFWRAVDSCLKPHLPAAILPWICVCVCVFTCVCLYVAQWALFAITTLKCFLLRNVVLSAIIAVWNVSMKNKMPTIHFSTPEQPPGDTRRKVSDFLGSNAVALAWRWHHVEICVLCWLIILCFCLSIIEFYL